LRITILAVGRLRGGPEAELTADYLARFEQTGDRRNRGREAESELLLGALPDGAALAALDERGRAMASPEFAKLLADWRDQGRRHAAFAIGGADGHAKALRERADLLVSFGPMVWPHMLARVMLSEQLYRAAAILAGTPYHRA
jgi:23S rRNA (pseudouridine1915-N3)-methyltransferase